VSSLSLSHNFFSSPGGYYYHYNVNGLCGFSVHVVPAQSKEKSVWNKLIPFKQDETDADITPKGREQRVMSHIQSQDSKHTCTPPSPLPFSGLFFWNWRPTTIIRLCSKYLSDGGTHDYIECKYVSPLSFQTIRSTGATLEVIRRERERERERESMELWDEDMDKLSGRWRRERRGVKSWKRDKTSW